jgi:hypothetical protein
MYFTKIRATVGICVCATFVLFQFSVFGQTGTTNSWIRPSSGDWDDFSAWSLGVVPASSQAVLITNSVWKAVAIDASTPINFSNSMSVGSLTIRGAWDTMNTLLLNYAGVAVPLRINTDLRVETNSALVSYYSAVRAANFYLSGDATFDQQSEGNFNQVTVGVDPNPGQLDLLSGFIQAGSVVVNSQSTLNVSNGCILNVGGLALNLPATGGVATVLISGSLGVTNPIDMGWGNIVMSGGYFQSPGITVFLGDLHQSGGTNDSGAMRLPRGRLSNGQSTYYLSGGKLLSSTLDLGDALPGGFTYYNGVLQQSGGLHTNSGGIVTWGVLRQAAHSSSGTYRLMAGLLDTPYIRVRGGFEQSGGTNRAGTIAVEDGGVFELSGGSLSSSNTAVGSQSGRYYYWSDLRSFYTQIAGSHAANQFSSNPGGAAQLQGGSLTVPTISVGPEAELSLGGAAVNNSGTFTILSASRVWANGNHPQLGKLIVQYAPPSPCCAPPSSDSVLDFGVNATTLRFRDSHDVTWTSPLFIANWSGSPTGGGTDRLYVGTSSQGLTPSQLAQIRFVNPSGLPAGTYSGTILATGEVVPTSGQTGGGTNYWTKPNSGFWEEPYWSLGVLPNSSQAVEIANQNWKAVAITASTPINFPDSMTVGSLAIRGAWDTMNTLVLDHVGTTPLTVLNGLMVQDMARIVNFNSSLVVQSGTILFTNAEIIQDFGLVRATNSPMYIQNSQYHLTNGLFEAGQMWLGWPVAASFNQYGGTAVISDLQFGRGVFGAGGTYALYGGNLSLPNGLLILGGNGSFSSYLQAGGTNRTTTVYLEPNLFGVSPSFTLNGGLLADNDVYMVADDYGGITISHNGGTHIVTNTLSVAGGNHHGTTIRDAIYRLNGGTLSARTLVLNGYQGDAFFVQSNGIAQAEQIQANASSDWWNFYGTGLTLAGGTLSCSNLLSGTGGNGIRQYGGALVVSNTLSYGAYLFMGGTLTASNINVGGTWVIGDSSGTRRITNSGTCSVGTLQISNAVELLGRFSLVASNVTIDLAGSASRLSFANSSGQSWAGGATLTVANWNGNPAGGGAEQLKFGTSQSGLTSVQVSQIQFVNPVGMPAGIYGALILATGEIVPRPRPALSMTRSSNGMVISWSGGYQLWSSTNLAGPYTVISGATSPYTNSFSGPRRFFYLRSP